MSGWETKMVSTGGRSEIVRTYDITCLGPLDRDVSFEECTDVLRAPHPVGKPREIIAAAEALAEVMGLDVEVGGFVVRRGGR